MQALIPLPQGVEEMEAVIVIDTLRRAKWKVTATGFDNGPVTAARQVRLLPDACWEDVSPLEYDILIIPGGAQGAAFLRRHAGVLQAIRGFQAAGKWMAAICAGPTVLQAAGVISGRTVTSHPDVAQDITQARWVDQPVALDGRLITSQGPGTSLRFALAIIAQLDSPETARAVARGMRADY